MGSVKSSDTLVIMEKAANKNITITDVADELGVSRSTVSRAISGKGRIGKETRTRVMEYIEKSGYKPNVIAKGLAQSKTYNLGIVLPGEYNIVDLHYVQECLLGIHQIAGEREYDLILSICWEKDLSTLERLVSNRKVDGVILMHTFSEDVQVEYLLRKKMPFVTVLENNVPTVAVLDVDAKEAGRIICRMLLDIIEK